MNRLLLSFIGLGACTAALAQTPAPTPFIKGAMTINFGTVAQADGDNIPVGAADVYTITDLNVANSAKFHGTITRLPAIHKTFGSDQAGNLNFDIAYDVINPRNLSQSRNIGQLSGDVPVDKVNVYHFGDGTAGIKTFGIGAAVPIDSKFIGTAVGKPPSTPQNILQRLRNQAVTITRSIHGQNVKIVVTKYDKMDFQNLVLPAGPSYPEVTVSGSMLYDYERNAWHFVNFSCSYYDRSPGMYHPVVDTLSGDIRWVEDPARETNGKGEYDFDVRVNEPPPSDSAVFAAPTTEADFFSTDDSVQALTGTMKYVDTFKGEAKDDNVSASAVQIDLTGNRLTKQQTMYLCKLLIFSAVVPMNSE